MTAQSDPGLPRPMDGAPSKAGFKSAHAQAPKASKSDSGPTEPAMSTVKRRTGPTIKTRGTNRGAR